MILRHPSSLSQLYFGSVQFDDTPLIFYHRMTATSLLSFTGE